MDTSSLYLQIDNPILTTGITVPKSGTLLITQATSQEAVIYDSLVVDGTIYRFNLTERGVFGTTATTFTIGATVQIYDRQNKDSFLV